MIRSEGEGQNRQNEASEQQRSFFHRGVSGGSFLHRRAINSQNNFSSLNVRSLRTNIYPFDQPCAPNRSKSATSSTAGLPSRLATDISTTSSRRQVNRIRRSQIATSEMLILRLLQRIRHYAVCS